MVGLVAGAVASTASAVKSGTAIVIDKAVPVVVHGAGAVAHAVPAVVSGTGAVVNYTVHAVPAMISGTTAKAVIGVAGGAVVGYVAVPGAALMGLNLMGFTSIGPAAGSLAAGWMSSIAASSGGGVVAGSLYSAFNRLPWVADTSLERPSCWPPVPVPQVQLLGSVPRPTI